MNPLKIIPLIALGIGALAAPSAQANEWVLGPAFKEGWKPQFTVAAMGGVLNPDEDKLSDGDAYYGVEISLNCPWFAPPTGSIRQQFWIGRYDENDVTFTSFEVNPRYFIDLSPNWSLGAGPGFGYLKADTPFRDGVDMFTLQLGADLSYRIGPLFLGVGARYQFTDDKEIAPGVDGADNWVAVGKIGVNF